MMVMAIQVMVHGGTQMVQQDGLHLAIEMMHLMQMVTPMEQEQSVDTQILLMVLLKLHLLTGVN